MFNLGEKIRFFDREVVVLTICKNEVLIFIDEHTIKWVDQTLLETVLST
jgi:hypothetical protein